MNKIFKISLATLAALALTASLASAHAVVKPSEVGIGAYQTFTLGVPTEKEIATVGVRLVVPENLGSIMPNVKPGWKIEIKKVATGKMVEHHGMQEPEMRVSEVVWTGGNIPDGQRDEFIFSAKTPAEPGQIVWKIHQTYADGSVVSWDLDPGAPQPQKDGKPDFSSKGPASVTKVVDDLSGANNSSSAQENSKSTQMQSETSGNNGSNRLAQTALALSCVAVIASAFALGNRKKV